MRLETPAECKRWARHIIVETWFRVRVREAIEALGTTTTLEHVCEAISEAIAPIERVTLTLDVRL